MCWKKCDFVTVKVIRLSKHYKLPLIFESATKNEIFKQSSSQSKRNWDLYRWNIYKNLIEKVNDGGYIIEGFPKNIEQTMLMELDKTQYDLVVELFQPENVIIAKSENKRICTSCSVSYNSLSYNIGKYNLPEIPPLIDEQCDYCEGPLTQRPKDDMHRIKKRFFNYQVNQELLREYFTKKNKFLFFDLLHGVNDLHSLIQKIDGFFES